MTRPTRAARAAALHKRLVTGPQFGDHAYSEAEKGVRQKARAEFMVWLSSWITPEIVALVPELRKEYDL